MAKFQAWRGRGQYPKWPLPKRKLRKQSLNRMNGSIRSWLGAF